jgi:STE24 endopeptidase
VVTPDPGGPAADLVAVPEPSAEALRYYHSGNVLWIAATAWGLLVPGLILFSGFSGRLRDWAQVAVRGWFPVVAVYTLLYLVTIYLLDLPLSWYQGFVRQHEFGLSNQSLGQWFSDSLKGLLVMLVMGVATISPVAPLAASLVALYRPRSGAVSAAVLTDPAGAHRPLFDDFGPMQDTALEAEILALADGAGIHGGRVLEVNKSEDTETVNAYVGGLFGTQRIVLWDTLLAKLDHDQVLVVWGHEMGHYVLGHVWTLFALLCALVFAGLYGVHRSLGFLIRRYRNRLGFSDPSDIASLPLLVLLSSVFFLLAQPVVLGYSRHIEREADRFGLEITQANRAMATASTVLQEGNLAHPRPGPLYVLWRSRHPSIAERIELANHYRPWESGRPLTYGSHFRAP